MEAGSTCLRRKLENGGLKGSRGSLILESTVYGSEINQKLELNGSDNSEFFTRDDEILFRNQFAYERKVPCEAPATAGLMGRLTGTEMMNKVRYVFLGASK